MSELEELRSKIRKDIPRLMEVRDRCRLIDFESEYIVLNDNIMTKKACYDVSDNRRKKYIHSLDQDTFKIIGHDILLSDVLEWCGDFIKMYISGNYLHFYWINKVGERFSVKWDLSKPYLKDQSEELINYLYNLIK